LMQLQQEFMSHSADYAAFKSDVGNKNNLLTSDKTSLVSAINEVFTTGNNVKSDTVGALLSVDPNLPINVGSSWEDVINAIGQISTGKKWAIGEADIQTSNLKFEFVGGGVTTFTQKYITVSGLDFKPSHIIAMSTGGSHGISVFTSINDVYFNYTPTIKVAGYPATSGSATVMNYKGDAGDAYAVQGGFQIPVEGSGTQLWVAFE